MFYYVFELNQANFDKKNQVWKIREKSIESINFLGKNSVVFLGSHENLKIDLRYF